MSKKAGPKELLMKHKNKLIIAGVAITTPIAYLIFRKNYKTTTEKHYLNINTSADQRKEDSLGLEIISHPNMDLETIDVGLEMNYLNYHKQKGIHWKKGMTDDYFYKNKVLLVKSNLMRDLVEASFNVHNMCLNVVDLVANDSSLLDKFGIPLELHESVKKSWERKDQDFAGRMEFMWNGEGKPKFVEYKTNNLSYIVEASRGQELVINKFAQLYGVRSLNSLNYIENAIGVFWRNFRLKGQTPKSIFIVSNPNDIKEVSIANFLKTVLSNKKYGNKTELTQIHLKNSYQNLGVSKNNEINVLFKVLDVFRPENLESASPASDSLVQFEPHWKLILESKALLAMLWFMYPNNPYLIPAYFEHSSLNNSRFVMKNVLPGSSKSIFQERCESAEIKGKTFSFDLWVIMGLPVGLGVRLRRGKDESFIPHFYKNAYEDFLLKFNSKDKEIREQLYGKDADNIFDIYERRARNFKLIPI